MKKALIVANMGGFASFLLDDIDILQNKGYEITYIADLEKLPWEDTKKKLVEKNVKCIHVSFDTKNPFSKENRKAYKKIKRIISSEYFDIIHSHTPIVGLLTKIASKKTRKNGSKVIYTTHGFPFHSKSSKKSWLLYYTFEKISSKYCDAIITINNEDFINAKTMLCKNVFYINGVGVDTEKYNLNNFDKITYKKRLGIDTSKIMILSIGELSERKNHKVIIEALSLLDNKDEYVYVICGNGVNGGTGVELKKLADEKGVNIVLLGFRFDIPEIINCSDFGAIPSIREGLGLAGIQSLAAGIPLVASDVQGIKDYVIENKTGYLCDCYDSKAFSNNILALSDYNIRVQMEAECKEVAKRFDKKISKKQRMQIYEQIMVEGKRDE